MEILIFIVNLLHSISASIWLGGCVFMIGITLNEEFKVLDNSNQVFIIISSTLREIVNGSMIIIFLTGIIMTIQKLSLVQTDINYAIILGIKIVISIGILYRIWQFRNTGYPKYNSRLKEWVLGYNSFSIWGVLIFLLADLLNNIS
ncbi:MAG: hypothetical protein CL769_05560 [Chloroflexi bacterium]|nr:hypothetical protein [Chloroflexota bacterium]MBK66402.1 hypothetical protein [Chloroflexota bacterium]|tara:strand:+ start:1016 stop:1453 length:438 start_codon:yes stop_codon:yes gene_type:complete